MSAVTEVEDVDPISSQSLQSFNLNSRMAALQLNPTLVESSSTLLVPEKRINESEKVQNMVPLPTLEEHSNAEIVNNSENGNFPEIYTPIKGQNMVQLATLEQHSNTEIDSGNGNQYLMLDINADTIKNQYVNKDCQIVDHTKQVFKQSEVEDNLILDPIVRTTEEQCGSDNFCKQNTSVQESNPQDENKNCTLIQNSCIQTDKSQKPSSLIKSTAKVTQSHTETIQSSQTLAYVDADAPILTHILVNISESESLIILDCMRRIEKWFAKLDELNQYNTVRFRALLQKMVDFNRLASLVKEKQVMLIIARDLSLLDLQSEEGLNFEMSTYRSLHGHCERVLRLLISYEHYLNAAYVRHNRLRTRYLDCSLQIAMYPIEEKLFENRKQTMNIINQSTKLMNKISSELKQTDNYTDKLSFECISTVNNFFRDCEVTFSP